MPDNIQNSTVNINQSSPLVHSYGFGRTVNVNNDSIQNILIENYKHVVFDSSTRTIWYKGIPYGVSYQFNETNSYNNTVLGEVLTHGVSGVNNIISGSYNQMSSVINGGIALGSYNKCDNTNTYSYIFTIGNGESEKKRSNLLAIHKAKDSTDRTTTSLTGYLNVEHLESNISYSYVSSLGKSATADIILKALLTPAEYYKPSGLSINLTNTVQNIECGGEIQDITISSITLPKPMSKYDYNYIGEYIKNNNKLPDNIKLSDFGYAWTFTDTEGHWWTDGYEYTVKPSNSNQSVAFTPDGLITTTNNPSKSYRTIRVNVAKDSTTDISRTNSTLELEANQDSTVINFSNIKINYPGTYKCGKKISLSVYYTVPQLSYFEQLVKNNVFVISDGNAWTNPINEVKTEIGDNFCTIYTGFQFYYGMCYAETDTPQNAKFFKDLLEGTAPIANRSKIIKKQLTTVNVGSMLSSGTIQFYSNMFDGGADKKYNCAFICFPENNLTVTKNFGGTYWLYKSGPGDPESTLSGDTSDPRNYDYTFNSYNLCKSGQNITWRVIAVKSTSNFAMSSSTSSWYGLKILAKKNF